MNPYMDFFIEDGILIGVPKKKYELTLDISKQMYESRMELCKGKKYPTLIISDSIEYVSKEVREFHNKVSATSGATAWALVTNQTIAKTFINLFLSITDLPVPTKYFSNKQDAINWLNQFK